MAPPPARSSGPAGHPHPGPDLDRVIDAYLDHLRVERGLSARTLEAYARDLARFAGHCEAAGAPGAGAITASVVSTHLVRLGKDGMGARSAARHLSAIRGLCRFLVQEGHLEADPCALVDRPRLGRRRA